jgi:S1-C subfamily serine protease
MTRLSRVLLATSLTLALPAIARADDRGAALKARLESVKASLVTVELTARVAVERLPGLGEGARRIVRTDATGIVVTEDGLVVFAASRVDPSAPAFALLGSRARAEVEKVLVIGADGKPREATWVGRDEERGLAFVRVGVAGRAGLTPIALPDAGASLAVGDELAVVSLAPRVLGRAPRLDVVRVAFETEKPRHLFGTSPTLAQALGGVVFKTEGASTIAGFVIGLPAAPEAPAPEGPAGKDVLSPDVLATEAAGYVLPSADLKAAVAKPPAESKTIAATRRARSWIGFKPETVTPEVAKLHKLGVDDGVRVAKVYKGTPAETAGLAENDVITRLDGELVSLDPGESFRTLEDLGVGQKVKLTVLHEGKGKEIELALVEAPTAPEDASRRRVPALDAVVRDLTFFDKDDLGLPDGAGGAVVVDLDADGSGSRAGLRVNDAILSVDGKDVPNVDGLTEALGDSGEKSLAVRRGPEKLALKLRR